jgi:transposase
MRRTRSRDGERPDRALEDAERRIRQLERALAREQRGKRESERKLRRAEMERDEWKEKAYESKGKARELEKKVTRLEARLALYEQVEESGAARRTPSSFVTTRAKPDDDEERRPHPGNPGHRGASRRRPTRREVDKRELLDLHQCPKCGTGLGDPIDRWERCVEDIAPAQTVKVLVITLVYWCPKCKTKVWQPYGGALPKKRLGIYLTAFIAFLRVLGMTLAKVQSLLKEVWSLRLSRQAIQEAAESAAQAFGDAYLKLLRYARRAKARQGDESPWPVNGDPWWAWVVTWKMGTLFHIDPKRGGEVVTKLLGKNPRGVTGRDGWQAYTNRAGLQQLDLVHVNRDIQKIEVKKGIEPRGFLLREKPKYKRRGHPPTEFLRFAKLMRRLMADPVRFVEGRPGLAARRKAYARFVQRYKSLARRPWKDGHVRSFLNGLRRNRAADFLFTFVRVTGVPWHTNGAEQALRPLVVNRKMSYGSRSPRGAAVTAILQSMAQTQRKQGKDVAAFFRNGLWRRAAKA